MSPPSLHTDRMRRQIASVLRSGDPNITTGARRAAATALHDPAAMTEVDVFELAQALTHLAGQVGSLSKSQSPGASEAAPPSTRSPRESTS